MDEPAKRLEEKLRRLASAIEKLPEWACSPDVRDVLKAKIRNVEANIRELSGCVITIGILGGTGVGKSTIMNALAGEVVSLASHRRPYTSELIIYAHEETPIPGSILESNLPMIFYRHRADKARNMIICDVPDFDSIALEHRILVQAFLNRLDLLVWVVSPEKYADEAFYKFLQEVIKEKDPSNFYFVMNKIDLLGEDPERLKLLTASFTGYLAENGIARPVIFLVSAKEVLEGEVSKGWNQWMLFEREIFRERELKEIREIKHSNILREIEQIEEEVNKAAQACIDASGHIKALRQELSQILPSWEREGKRVVGNLIRKEFIESILAQGSDSGHLKGPAFLIAQLIRGRSRNNGDSLDIPITEATMAPFSSLADQLNRLLLLRSLPDQLFQEISALYDPTRLWTRWKEKMELLFDEIRREFEIKRARLLGFAQSFSYWGLFVIFVLAMGEFRYVSEKPLWIWLGERVLRFFERIFTSEGLGALLSLLILEILAGYYFFRIYRKGLQERAQKVIEMAGSKSLELWKQTIVELDERLRLKEEFYSSWMENKAGLS